MRRMWECTCSYTCSNLGDRSKRVVSFTPFYVAPGEGAPRIHLRKSWMGSRAGLDEVAKENTAAPAGNRAPVVQPVAQTLA
jgi:hypothetical protein